MTSKSRGGLELYVTDLILRQREYGFQVSAIIASRSPAQEILHAHGVRIFEVSAGSRYNMFKILKTRKLVKTVDPQIIHAHTNTDMWLAVLATLGKKIPVIFSLYMGASRKQDFLHKLIFSRISFLVSSSDTTNNEVAQLYAIDPGKIKLLRYGRDAGAYKLTFLKRMQLRREFKVPGGYLVAGTMSRIDLQKGVKEFITAISLLPEKAKIHFYIFGDRTIDGYDETGNPIFEKISAAYYDDVVRTIQEKNLTKRVTMIPFRKDYIPVLMTMDIFVLPSYNEMYGLAVLDAMLAGLPVIGTNRGGTAEQVVHGKTGWLIEPQSPTEIAYALQKYLTNTRLIQKHGAAGKAKALAEHDWEKVMTGCKNIYNQACGTSIYET